MRNLIQVLICTFCFALFTGCATYYPKESNLNDESNCKLLSKSLVLEAEPMKKREPYGICIGILSSCGIRLWVESVVPVGSFIVSGSIVVVNNTAHWIERQGRCEDSATQRAISEFTIWLESQTTAVKIDVPEDVPGQAK